MSNDSSSQALAARSSAVARGERFYSYSRGGTTYLYKINRGSAQKDKLLSTRRSLGDGTVKVNSFRGGPKSKAENEARKAGTWSGGQQTRTGLSVGMASYARPGDTRAQGLVDATVGRRRPTTDYAGGGFSSRYAAVASSPSGDVLLDQATGQTFNPVGSSQAGTIYSTQATPTRTRATREPLPAIAGVNYTSAEADPFAYQLSKSARGVRQEFETEAAISAARARNTDLPFRQRGAARVAAFGNIAGAWGAGTIEGYASRYVGPRSAQQRAFTTDVVTAGTFKLAGRYVVTPALNYVGRATGPTGFAAAQRTLGIAGTAAVGYRATNVSSTTFGRQDLPVIINAGAGLYKGVQAGRPGVRVEGFSPERTIGSGYQTGRGFFRQTSIGRGSADISYYGRPMSLPYQTQTSVRGVRSGQEYLVTGSRTSFVRLPKGELVGSQRLTGTFNPSDRSGTLATLNRYGFVSQSSERAFFQSTNSQELYAARTPFRAYDEVLGTRVSRRGVARVTAYQEAFRVTGTRGGGSPFSTETVFGVRTRGTKARTTFNDQIGPFSVTQKTSGSLTRFGYEGYSNPATRLPGDAAARTRADELLAGRVYYGEAGTARSTTRNTLEELYSPRAYRNTARSSPLTRSARGLPNTPTGNVLRTAQITKSFNLPTGALAPQVFQTAQTSKALFAGAGLSTFARTTARTRARQVPGQTLSFETLTIPRQPTIPTTTTASLLVTQQRTRPLLDTFTFTGRTTTPFTPTTNTPTTPPPPPFLPFGGLPALPFPIPPSRGARGGPAPGRSFSYTPSLAAIFFDIRGEAPATLGGLEVRPIPTKRRRRKR